MDLRAIILDEIRTVAREQKKQLPPLTDGLSLQESGFELPLFRDFVRSPRGYHWPRPLGDGHRLSPHARGSSRPL